LRGLMGKTETSTKKTTLENGTGTLSVATYVFSERSPENSDKRKGISLLLQSTGAAFAGAERGGKPEGRKTFRVIGGS